MVAVGETDGARAAGMLSVGCGDGLGCRGTAIRINSDTVTNLNPLA